MNINRFSRYTCFTVLLLSLAVGCTTDTGNQSDLLIGNWELDYATRNGNHAETFAELYFNFDAEGNMDTNLPIAKGTSTYSVNGNTIQQQSPMGTVEYTIEEIGDSSLILATTARGFEFRFAMKRVQDEIQ